MYFKGCLSNPSASITPMWAGQFTHNSFTRSFVAKSTIHLLLAENGKDDECDAKRDSTSTEMQSRGIECECFPIIVLYQSWMGWVGLAWLVGEVSLLLKFG